MPLNNFPGFEALTRFEARCFSGHALCSLPSRKRCSLERGNLILKPNDGLAVRIESCPFRENPLMHFVVEGLFAPTRRI